MDHCLEYLFKDLVNFLFNKVVGPVCELVSPGRGGIVPFYDAARHNLEVVLNGHLDFLNGRGKDLVSFSGLLEPVATRLGNTGVVRAATAVPSKQVGGVLGKI